MFTLILLVQYIEAVVAQILTVKESAVGSISTQKYQLFSFPRSGKKTERGFEYI